MLINLNLTSLSRSIEWAKEQDLAHIDGFDKAHWNNVINTITKQAQRAYKEGYNDGYEDGYEDGYKDGFRDGVNSLGS